VAARFWELSPVGIVFRGGRAEGKIGDFKTMKIYRKQKMLIFYISVVLAPLVVNAADSPTAQIKSTIDQVITLLIDPRLQGEGKKAERHELFRQAIFARFDFQEMARRSLGAHWRRRTVQEQNQFVALFSDLLEKAYLDRIESYNKEKFIYINEKIEEPYADVGSRISTAKGEEFSIHYRLHRVGEQWKIYDVVIEDISLVNNYRSQFDRVISKSSYAELVRRMKNKLSDNVAKQIQ
jgi:phospholipid transport system substrate-binding protein